MASKPPSFTHLHVHSHYSLLDGLPKIGQLLERVKELGMDSVAVTDHGNLYGAVEFYKKAKDMGIKPILGAEIYLAFEGMEQKRPQVDDANYHMILLVQNEQGYGNLVKILTAAHLRGYYYKPRVDEAFLREHSQGLIALSACLSGRIAKLILSKKVKEAEDTALRYQEIFGKGNFYIEIQHHPNISEQKTANEGLIQLARNLDIPLVATADSHYLRREDAEAQDILMLINTGAKAGDPERLTLLSDDFSFRSGEEMEELFAEFPDAIENTRKIADRCNLVLEIGKTKLPVYPLPEGKDANDYLRELCLKGMEAKPEMALYPQAMERVEYELGVIRQTGFASYFLIVQDFVNWAKNKRIVVGPGRGSAGGSLVAYLLRITNINPLAYNLLFERFLNPERISMPDIDLDFADYRRDEVIQYVSEKYGHDRVAQIITFGTMAARAVIRDVGRALGYEYGYCDRVAKLIPFNHNLEQCLEKVAEFRELYDKEEKAKKLIDLAKKLEGVARHASTHACGVVISALPLDTVAPLQHPTQNDENIVTQYEMHSIEDLGLLKMDFLGLKNLTIIEDTLKRIYVIHGINVDIERVPLDDAQTYKLFQDANTVGIFQVESDGMRRYLRELKPTEFEDIIAMIALYRPGPMELIPEYIARKHGRQAIAYIHPKLQDILGSTQGICIYQEQLMRIARDLAGFTLGEADVLRKAVGKKIKALLLEQQEKFTGGMVKNGIDSAVANQLWEWVLPFARYGFNKSHSAAYAIIAYQTAWLKTHYPVEFMSALLTAEKNDIERVAFIVDEAKRMSIAVLPPDVNESFSNFSVVPQKNQIRFGLLAIKNVGEGVVEAIIQERKANGPYGSVQDFVSRVSAKDLNKKSLESMVKAGVFDRFAERGVLLANMERLLEASREQIRRQNSAQQSLFGAGSGSIPALSLEAAPPVPEPEKLQWEKELLGLYVSSHPLKAIKSILEKKAFSIAKVMGAVSRDRVQGAPSHEMRIRIGGIVSSIKRIVTKSGKPMLFLGLEDLTDKIEVVVFPSVIEKYPAMFEPNKVVLIGGRINDYQGIRKFIAEEIEEFAV